MPERTDIIPPSPSAEDYLKELEPEDSSFFSANDPISLFSKWFLMARDKEPHDPNAMALATVDKDGLPDNRMVLLKDFNAQGFVFYTNSCSAKGQQLDKNAKAALCFYWKSIRCQIRLRGAVEPVSAAEADEYFASRAKDAQIGAWASDQSSPMKNREELAKRLLEMEKRFSKDKAPRPPFWSGYRLMPIQIEFWRNGAFRLHERLQFFRDTPDASWQKQRLFP